MLPLLVSSKKGKGTLLQGSEDRIRLGIKNQASLFFLLSPFTSLTAEQRRFAALGIKNQASLFFLLSFALSLSNKRL